MIDPEVKWIDYTDEFPQDHGSPFMLAMTAGIGPRFEEGADNFQVIVCNTAWLEAQLGTTAAIWPRGYLLVKRLDVEHIKDTIQSLALTFRRSPDWLKFSERLNRYLLWEFEDLDDFQGDVKVPWPQHR